MCPDCIHFVVLCIALMRNRGVGERPTWIGCRLLVAAPGRVREAKAPSAGHRRRAVDGRVAEDPARARRLRRADGAHRHARRGDLPHLVPGRRRHRHDAAGRRRHRSGSPLQAGAARGRGDRDHRSGQHPAIGGSGEGRGVRLSREAHRRRSPARQARKSDQAEVALGRERTAQAEAAGSLQVPERHRPAARRCRSSSTSSRASPPAKPTS